MCRPSFYGVEYQINPWMNLSNRADKVKALEQWNNLVDRIIEHGGEVRLVKERPGLPDMVFTANAGLAFPHGRMVVISNFKHSERKGEEEWFVQWFAEEGWAVHYPDAPFEGAGDCLRFGDLELVGGYGFRSDQTVYEEFIDPMVAPVGTVAVRLVDPRFYHLDTCFCPLRDKDYMVFPGAFDEEGISKIRLLGGNEITVPEEEAVRFACNSVQIGGTVILPVGCPITVQLLAEAGYNAVPVDMSEFLKAGGACKCLTLEIG